MECVGAVKSGKETMGWRVSSAIALTIVGASAAGGQSQRPLNEVFISPAIMQPSYGAQSRRDATNSPPSDGYPSPAIPVALSADERRSVHAVSEGAPGVLPCAGEPFYVWRPTVRVNPWALSSITGPDAGMFVFGTGDVGFRYTRESSSYYSARPSYGYGGWTRSYASSSAYSYGNSTRALSSSAYYQRSTGYQWGSSGYGYSQLTWSTYSAGNALWAYPWLREVYGPFLRGRVQAEPASGTWRMPDAACYTRDPRGNVVVIP